MGILSLINDKGAPGNSFKPVPPNSALERDPFAPNFKIIHYGSQGAIGSELDESVTKFISEISFELNADQFDHLSIKFENQADDFGGGDVLSLMDSKLFKMGSILEVQMGWGNHLMTVGGAIIVKMSPEFPAESFPSFTLDAYDLLYKASRSRPKGGDAYKGSTVGQIVRKVAIRNGFNPFAIGPTGEPSVQDVDEVVTKDLAAKFGGQNKGVSDYEFLRKVADVYGFELFSQFDPKTKKFNLFFQPQGKFKSKETFTFFYNAGDVPFRSKLLSFTPTLDAVDQATDYEVFVIKDKKVNRTKTEFIDQLTLDEQKKIKEQEEQKFTGGNFGKSKTKHDGLEYAFKAYGRSFMFPPHKRFKDEEKAKQAIEKFINDQRKNFITGSGDLLGLEALQPRQIHVFEGLTKQFSGKYYFTRVEHVMSKNEGYTCSFSARRMIEDKVIQAPPSLVLSEVDKALEKLKGLD